VSIRVLLLVFPALLMAEQPPVVVTNGTLLERDTGSPIGEFSVREADNHVFRYRFDEKTLVDRNQLTSSIDYLQAGDKVEVIAEDGPQFTLRYARTVHVLEASSPLRRVPQERFHAFPMSQERSFPNGTLTYSGIVSRLNPQRMVLHTRGSGDQTILLRQDTRYLDNGSIVESTELRTNMRVFVRAGHTLLNDVEAYQVVWGQILLP
jgi:hypothetical protein